MVYDLINNRLIDMIDKYVLLYYVYFVQIYTIFSSPCIYADFYLVTHTLG